MSDLKFTLRFDAENKQFIGQVKQAGTAVNQLGGSANTTQNKLKGLSTQSTHTTAQLGSLKNQVLGLAGGFSALYAAQQAADKLGQYQDIRTQITALVGSEEAWIETEQYLNQVAEEHNKTLVGMAGNYARLTSLQEAGLVTLGESRSLFEGMSNVQSQTGATAEQLNQSMYGLSQALASPIVRAEELNQVVEPMPGLLNKLDEAAGLSAGGFRQLMLAGEVTSDFFKETLIAALADYEGAAARTADNINAKYAEVTRAYEQTVVAFEEPISDSFSTVLENSAGALSIFAENADLVTTIVEVSLVAALARGTTAAAAFAAAKIQSIAATRAQEQAYITELRALEVKLLAEVRELEVMKQANNQKFRAIGAETSLTAKRGQLTATTNTLATAQSRLNVVTRAGAGAMALLGGPAGVAMIAAGAIAYFAKQSYDAQNPTKNLKDEVNGLVKEYASLNEQGQSVLLHNLGVEASTARTALLETQVEIRKVRKELENASSPSTSALKQTQLSELNQQAKQLEAAVEGSNQKLDAFLETSTKNNWKVPVAPELKKLAIDPKLEDQANKLLANLSKQNALYGVTSEAAKLRYEIEYGSLKGINDELAKKLLLEAQSIDGKRAEDEKKPQDTAAINAFYKQTDELEVAWLQRLAMEANQEDKARIQENYAYQARLDDIETHYQKAVEQAQGNKDTLAELDAEYRLQQELAEAEHQARMRDIEQQILQQREEDNRSYWERYLASMEQNLGNFDSLAANTIDSFSSGMGSAFESMIFDSENLGDAMATMAEGMSRSLINALGRMAAEWLAYQLVQKLVGMQAATSSAMAMSQQAQAQSLMAGLNAYSSTAAIPLSGPLLAPAAMTTALAATAPLAASVSALAFSSLAGQAHDGINRVPRENEGTWLLKANEMVLNPTQADSFRWMVDVMQQMQNQQAAMSPTTNANAMATAGMISQLKTAQAAMTTAAYGSSMSRGMPVTINVQGVDKSQVSATAKMTESGLSVEMIIEESKNAALEAIYSDADNGGPISQRIRKG